MSLFMMQLDQFSQKLVYKVLKSLENNPGVVPALKIDSIRKVKKNEYNNILRDDLQLIQTPQGFHFDQIFEAHRKYKKIY